MAVEAPSLDLSRQASQGDDTVQLLSANDDSVTSCIGAKNPGRRRQLSVEQVRAAMAKADQREQKVVKEAGGAVNDPVAAVTGVANEIKVGPSSRRPCDRPTALAKL